MSLALGKNSVNAKQPLHLDSTNHLLVNDSTNKAVLETIATNTANINVNVGDVEINVADLEGLQATTNTTLASILVDTDAIDSSCNTIEAQSVLTASRLNNIQNRITANTDGTGDTLGQINSNILTKNGEIETSLNSLISANHTDLVALETTLTAIETDQAAIEVLLTAANGKHAANETLLGTIDSDTDAIKTSTAACATDLAAIEVLITAGNGKHAANEALLGTIDSDTDAIKTSTAACATDLAAIEVLLTAANTDHAANEVLLTAIDADTSNIATSTAACATDLAALEVLQTATNSKLDDMIGHNDGVETLLTAIDGRVDGLETLQGAANTDLAAIEVLLTAANTDHAANEVLLTGIDQKLGDIETSVQAIDDIALAEDAAHSSGQKGVMFLGVRQSSQADFAADGDYTPLSIDDDGKLRVTSSAASGGATEAKQDVIETTLTAIETDAAALEVLQTSTNSKLDHLSGDLDTLETTLTAIETDAAAIEVLLTAANTDHAANEVLLTNCDTHLGEIEGAVETLEECVKTEDLAHSSGDKGFMIMGVRNSDNTSGANFGTQDGDYCPFSIDDDGGVRVHTNDAAMEVDTLFNASVGSSATGTSSSFTKPRGIKDAGIVVVANTNGTYNAFIEYSADNSTFIQGTNINFSSQQVSTGQIGTSAITAGYKFYRVTIANNHSGSQDFVVKISY